jgi:flagellar hook-length control protein FliK
MRQEQNLPDVDRAAGSPDNLLLEVVLVAQTPRGRTSGGEEKDGTGARKDEKERLSGPGMSAERMADQPVPGRFALTPKVEDQKNALHENILSQVKASVVSHDGKGNGTMTVRLNPVEFGELQVNVRIENQQVKVEIITDNRTVRDALMGNLDALKETFQKQNLTMERFDVSSGGGNGSGQGFREERGEQQRINPVMSGHEAASFETAREQIEDDWGGTENSLVNLRL